MKFTPSFAGKAIEPDGPYYPLPGGDSVQLETFKCYISGIGFYSGGKAVYTEPNSFHLLDAADTGSLGFTLQVPGRLVYDEIRFSLGIDSVTNVSGALGGALDPTKGMYWSWQSGYINLKLEGKSNLCPTRKNEFQFHLGGYANETKAVAGIALKVPNSGTIAINIPVDKFLAGINLATQNSIIIPCKEAVGLSHKMAQIFEVVQE